jgi:ABC-type polysaccharide/polyol phosphate export permease
MMTPAIARSLYATASVLLREQITFRELSFQMTRRDVVLRYKQTAMGFAWAAFMPLVNTIVFSVVFTRVAHVDTSVPYPIYAYLGLLAWNFFASALRFATTSLTSNANLVAKVYFPREIFPFSAVAVALIDTLVGATVLVAMMAYYRLPLGWPLLALPLVLAVHVALTAAAALLLSMANLFYRDVKYVFDIVLQVGMFATAVVYPLERVGGRMGALLGLNPLTTIINAYRAVLLENAWPPAVPLAAAGVGAFAALAAAWVCFHQSEMRFAENI